MVSKDTNSTEGDLQIFNETWNHPNLESQRKWQEAIWKEFGVMKNSKKMHKSLIPPNCKCVKNKWVFKIKWNVVHLSWLVARGYSQVLDVNFSENYSIVVNNITFCILLLCWNLDMEVYGHGY